MMVNPKVRDTFLIVITFFVAMVLLILPLPHWALWGRPDWVFLILLFWLVQAPRKVGPGTALMVGLYVDVLTGSFFGQHALVYVLTSYCVLKCIRIIQAMPMWQQLFWIMVLSSINLSIQWLVMRAMQPMTMHWQFWLPALTNAMIWPWLYVLLREFRPRYEFDVI